MRLFEKRIYENERSHCGSVLYLRDLIPELIRRATHLRLTYRSELRCRGALALNSREGKAPGSATTLGDSSLGSRT